MNHEEYQELVSQFIDRELIAERERQLFAHLAGCEECRQFLKDALLMQTDIKSRLPKGELPLHGTFAADRRPVQAANHRPTIRSAVSTLVLFMLLTLMVGLLFSTNVQGRSSQMRQGVEPIENVR